jgi:glutamate 5-kinase
MELPYHRIIIKLGTRLLTSGKDSLDLDLMGGLVHQTARLHQEGAEIIIVSSGAIASGREKFPHLDGKGKIPLRQTLASIGQGRLMYTYDHLFGKYGIYVAQALLTKHDLSSRSGYLNARNVLLSLLALKVIPIVNNNDVVSTDEVEELKFGDNDTLSAHVASLVSADLLAILGDVEGLYTQDPEVYPEAKLIPCVPYIDEKVMEMASPRANPQGMGGMQSKVGAAKLATGFGTAVVIASGRKEGIILDLARGKPHGTLFPPRVSKLESRRRFLMSGPPHKGKLMVDGGASSALREGEGSLLPVGIVDVQGNFERGDIVDVIDVSENMVGCGMCNYSSSDIGRIKGLHSDRITSVLGYTYGEEAIHRNNLVVLK